MRAGCGLFTSFSCTPLPTGGGRIDILCSQTLRCAAPKADARVWLRTQQGEKT